MFVFLFMLTFPLCLVLGCDHFSTFWKARSIYKNNEQPNTKNYCGVHYIKWGAACASLASSKGGPTSIPRDSSSSLDNFWHLARPADVEAAKLPLAPSRFAMFLQEHAGWRTVDAKDTTKTKIYINISGLTNSRESLWLKGATHWRFPVPCSFETHDCEITCTRINCSKIGR